MEDTQKIILTKAQFRVIKAIIKKEKKEALQGICIDQKHIICTNGRVLFMIEHDQNYILGNWRVLGEETSVKTHSVITLGKMDLEYPDYKAVMPEETKDIIQVSLIDEYSISRAMINLYKLTSSAFCYSILDIFAPLKLTWSAHKAAQDRAVLLIADNMRAVILPLRA